MNEEVEILLIEDDPGDAEMTIMALKDNHLTNKLLHLKDGVLALDYIFAKGEYAERQQIESPKVILLDLKMPRINGIEVLQELKANPSTRKIPVVILTSSREDPDIEMCYNLGVNSYVVKPVEFENFIKAISQLGLYWMILNQTSNK